MRAILIISVFFFPFLVFSDLIEIVPEPVNNIVGTNKVVVRGHFNSEGREIRISVSQSGKTTRYYYPVILRTLRTELEGYYAYGVELFEGLNNIRLEKNNTVNWIQVNSQPVQISYYSGGTEAGKSLWGRIANDGTHKRKNREPLIFIREPVSVLKQKTEKIQQMKGEIRTPFFF